MKLSQRLKTLIQAADRFWKKSPVSAEEYPDSVVDLVIFHKLHFHMAIEDARRCFSRLKSEFVDWNEVRISVVREIQEQIAGANDSLELTVFVKDFLEYVHKERRSIDLEPILEENLSDVRRFFKGVRGLDPSTVEFVLMRKKSHPVMPLSVQMEEQLSDLGVVQSSDSRDRKSKSLFELVGEDGALPLHHYLLYYVHANSGDNRSERTPAALQGGKKSKKDDGSSRKVVRKPVATKTVRSRSSKASSSKSAAVKSAAVKKTKASAEKSAAKKKTTSKKAASKKAAKKK